MLPIFRRASADRDVEGIVDHYLTEGGANLALAFIDALEAAYAHLARQPSTGSPRYGQALAIPGLRSWPLGRFPLIIFYFERTDAVEVWRVLHGGRDIPVHLQDPSAH